MDFLLNPNMAYVLLVMGLTLGWLAIVTPGTGLLELGAVFLLVLAGYSTYHLGFNLWALLVLLLSVVPFIYAIRKPKRELFLIISMVGIMAGSLYIFPSQGWLPAVNPFVGIFVSLLSSFAIWFVAKKALEAFSMPPAYNLEKLIGKIGSAKTAIHENGTIQVSGELWSARSKRQIPAGHNVRVVAREGFILDVEPVIDQGKNQ